MCVSLFVCVCVCQCVCVCVIAGIHTIPTWYITTVLYASCILYNHRCALDVWRIAVRDQIRDSRRDFAHFLPGIVPVDVLPPGHPHLCSPDSFSISFKCCQRLACGTLTDRCHGGRRRLRSHSATPNRGPRRPLPFLPPTLPPPPHHCTQTAQTCADVRGPSSSSQRAGVHALKHMLIRLLRPLQVSRCPRSLARLPPLSLICRLRIRGVKSLLLFLLLPLTLRPRLPPV